MLDEDDKPRDHELIDYEWTVSIHPHLEDLQIIHQYKCSDILHSRKLQQQQQEEEASLSTATAAAAAPAAPIISSPSKHHLSKEAEEEILSPWQWHSFEAIIDSPLEQAANVILSARILCKSTSHRKTLVKHCMVKARNVEVYGYVGKDTSIFTQNEINKLVPIFDHPHLLYTSNRMWTDYNEEEEYFKEIDAWKIHFDAHGIDTAKLHNTHLCRRN